jgi:aminopeptidase
MPPVSLAETAGKNARSIVRGALEHPSNGASALILSDRQCLLASLLADAYREALPGASALDAAAMPVEALRAIESLSPGDLVVLVQSTRFFSAEHRFRMGLFDRGLKVVEHPHLGKILESEIPAYVDALAYDSSYYRTVGPALKERIDAAREIRVLGGGGELVYSSRFEDAKLNIGDYRGRRNVGGQFPIGEVFTEAVDLERVAGEIPLFAFGDSDFRVAVPEAPIRLRVEAGVVVEAREAPPDFEAVLAAIRADEEIVRVRELGFGLNRAFTRERRVSDVGSYERMCGVHLSLGSKHAIYAKPGLSKRRTKFHVDVFVAVDRVEIAGEEIFSNGRYRIGEGRRVLDRNASEA